MKKMIGLSFLLSAIFFSSCNKDPVYPGSSRPANPVNPVVPANKFPVANAGPDVTVYFDLQTCRTDSVELDGRSSIDQDGRIVAYFWTGLGLITNRESANTFVRPLSSGQHQFILSVADDKSGVDSDTMIVNVVTLMNRPTISAQLIPVATLPQSRAAIAVGGSGSKIAFAGGYTTDGVVSSRVDIYDINTNSWSTSELSVGRQDIAVVTSGNKIFFAGGWEGDWWWLPTMYTNVDIYDAVANSWSVKHLSEPRTGIGAASAGSKVFFAGGTGDQASSKVDIYDTETDSWTTSALSEPRSNLSAQVAGDKIYFAGGSGRYGTPLTTIDIYDINTAFWSGSSMNEPKSEMKSFAMGSKILWAGGSTLVNGAGYYSSRMVEIKDINTQSSSFSCLLEPKSWWPGNQKAVAKDNQIIFFTGNGVQNKFDIYDIANNSWSIGELNKNIVGAAVISVNNTIYVAGGYVNGSLSNIVWKLEF